MTDVLINRAPCRLCNNTGRCPKCIGGTTITNVDWNPMRAALSDLFGRGTVSR
jgi:hypothetical protein